MNHSDDVWEKDKLEKQVSFLEDNPDTGAVYTLVTIIDGNGLPRNENSHHYSTTFNQENRTRFGWLRYFFFYGNALCHPSMLIRAQCYEKCGLYNPALIQLPDFDMWVRLCLKYEINILQEKLMRFRVLEDFSSASSPSIDNQVRLQFEHLQVLQNYLKLKKTSEFLLVFPEAEKYRDRDWFEPAYALAMIALENKNIKPSQLFGMQIFFDLLNNPEKSCALREHMGFDINTYKRISGDADVFYYRTQMLLENSLEVLAKCQQQVQFYSQSRSWKITAPFRKLMSFFHQAVNFQN